MSSTNAGLQALQTANTNLATAVQSAVAEIQALATQASQASGDPDSAVGQIAAQIQAQASALSAAVAAAQPAPAPAPSSTAPASTPAAS